MKKGLVCSILVALAAANVHAANVTSPADGRLPNKIYGVYRNSTLYGSPWGEITTLTWWAITQWVWRRYPSSSQELSTIYKCRGSCTNGAWEAASNDGRLRVRASYNTGGQTRYTLRADFWGAKFDACNEYDLLINADQRVSALNSVQPFSSQTSLGASIFYRYTWTQGLKVETHGTACDSVSGINYASSVAGLLFKNQASGEYLHYQIISSDSRFTGPGPYFDEFWFECNNKGFWGVSDDVAVYGDTYDVPGDKASKTYDLDIKKRLSHLIGNPSNCLPVGARNPEDWKLQGTYTGLAVDGEAKAEGFFHSIMVTTTP